MLGVLSGLASGEASIGGAPVDGGGELEHPEPTNTRSAM
jgi:hypothetical protein